MALEQSLRRNFFSSWLQTQTMERVGTSARSDRSLEHRELVPVFLADVIDHGPRSAPRCRGQSASHLSGVASGRRECICNLVPEKANSNKT